MSEIIDVRERSLLAQRLGITPAEYAAEVERMLSAIARSLLEITAPVEQQRANLQKKVLGCQKTINRVLQSLETWRNSPELKALQTDQKAFRQKILSDLEAEPESSYQYGVAEILDRVWYPTGTENLQFAGIPFNTWMKDVRSQSSELVAGLKQLKEELPTFNQLQQAREEIPELSQKLAALIRSTRQAIEREQFLRTILPQQFKSLLEIPNSGLWLWVDNALQEIFGELPAEKWSLENTSLFRMQRLVEAMMSLEWAVANSSAEGSMVPARTYQRIVDLSQTVKKMIIEAQNSAHPPVYQLYQARNQPPASAGDYVSSFLLDHGDLIDAVPLTMRPVSSDSLWVPLSAQMKSELSDFVHHGIITVFRDLYSLERTEELV